MPRLLRGTARRCRAASGPAELAGGRLAGDGYAVEVGGDAWFRTLRVTTTGQVHRSAAGHSHRELWERSRPRRSWECLTLARARSRRRSRPRSRDRGTCGRAILRSTPRVLTSGPWTRRGPDWQRSSPNANATRFLTRLCLTSHDRGDPESRAWMLNASMDVPQRRGRVGRGTAIARSDRVLRDRGRGPLRTRRDGGHRGTRGGGFRGSASGRLRRVRRGVLPGTTAISATWPDSACY